MVFYYTFNLVYIYYVHIVVTVYVYIYFLNIYDIILVGDDNIILLS